MDVLIDAYIRTHDAKYKDCFDKWYAGINSKNGGSYWNNFYDDMEWIALTMIRLYEVTDEAKYLDGMKNTATVVSHGTTVMYGARMPVPTVLPASSPVAYIK